MSIEPRHLAGNEAVRRTCGWALNRKEKPVTRKTLIYWRERHGFPEPLDAPRAGVELWDIREVRAWAKQYREAREALALAQGAGQ
jgi:hypothetical protein